MKHFIYFFPKIFTYWCIFFSSTPQDCDQIHIDDVSSDDNGQDLRYGISMLEAAGQVVLSCLKIAGSWTVI